MSVSPTKPSTAEQPIRWQSAHAAPTLSDTGLHLWYIDTADLTASDPGDLKLLSADERRRADRFVREPLRANYARVHAETRSILALYLEIGPAEIAFRYSKTGKPSLATNPHGIEFNLTTVTDLALLAVCRGRPLGIDCEQVRPRDQLMGIARRMFPADHAASLSRLPDAERLQAFYASWTALEAEVKVDGRGLAGREQAAPLAVDVAHFIPAAGHIGAVARHRLPPTERWRTLVLAGSYRCA